MSSHEEHDGHKGTGENTLAKIGLDAAFLIHTKLGPGLLESVYEVVLAHELRKHALSVERQKPMPIVYDGMAPDKLRRGSSQKRNQENYQRPNRGRV